MKCPNCGAAMAIGSETDKATIYICTKCKTQVVEKKD